MNIAVLALKTYGLFWVDGTHTHWLLTVFTQRQFLPKAGYEDAGRDRRELRMVGNVYK